MTQDQLKVEDLLTELEATKTLSRLTQTTTTKLPKLTIPTYSEDKLKWKKFWDSFKANIHHHSTAEVDKMSDVALDTVSDLLTTDSNYTLSVEA